MIKSDITKSVDESTLSKTTNSPKSLTGDEILLQIDKNMYSEKTITTTTMTIHGRRNSKTMKMKGWNQGENKSFSEYLYPPKDAGTKMLKLDDDLWLYNPDSDRTIQISGHLLRQPVMGSDLSYEDIMEDNELHNLYKAEIFTEETFQDRECWVLLLTAKVKEIAYESRKIWVDKERFLALKEERLGKSGKLLKTTTITEVFKVDGRWYPHKMIFKDVLKTGEGTEYVVESIEFDADIPESVFSKASLRK
jgi:outer membrane lipoprotein-sorting protein